MRCRRPSLGEPCAHEPRPRHGYRRPEAPQEHRRRQPLHGLRRARPRAAHPPGRQAAGGAPRPRRLRPHQRRDPQLLHRRHRCWFIDSDYNEESFLVRHAYFTGADEPYKKLQRALKAEIDEDAWSTLYSTVSRPFDPPSTGKIAVKVINHYGDEVLKVYETPAVPLVDGQ